MYRYFVQKVLQNNNKQRTIPVRMVDEHKRLGIILDPKLSFSAHIKAAISNARKGIGLLKHLSKFLPIHTLSELFKLYVRPHFDYGDGIHHIPTKAHELSGNIILPSLMNLEGNITSKITDRIWLGIIKLQTLGWTSYLILQNDK